MLSRLLETINYGTARYSIIAAKGNKKLPFYAFSTLPGVTCPGAGECLDYCYSFGSWRHPQSFGRMAQNAILMRFAPSLIRKAFNDIPDDADFRLYVDGDFASMADVNFWFDLLRSRPNVSAYGYSKSLQLLADYSGEFPTNYRLNLSSGHNAGDAIVGRIKTLPIYRGEFVAVNIGRKVKSADHGTRAVNNALRKSYGKSAFTCPGKCGSCTPKGHACGSSRFDGVDIIIAVH